MTTLLEDPLTNPLDLEIHAAQAEVVIWQGREALRLENGLALVPGHRATDASIEVLIGADGPAYPGIAFRVADVLNFELAYAVPHVSGQWDALQYDPVFHGSNTWQVYHGPSYQRVTQVPTGRWFRLRVDFRGARAAVSVDGQPPLVVERLAHPTAAGLLGLWTYRPAYFCDLRVSTCDGLDIPQGEMPSAAEGTVEAWFVEDYGVVTCEPNGVVNLNRYLPISLGDVRLTRRFETPEGGAVAFEFGFSDALSLDLDGQVLFSGENTFKGFEDRAARGYAELGTQSLQQDLSPGAHCLAATLRASEPFGWGLAFAVCGEGLHWLPVELG
ncbi:MAG: hypothetical protein E3J21_11465 [Anaerolineales bacterium]|nr:MAG: hypothetical protein E3J21_11465 [Anaerolineales bacterium]